MNISEEKINKIVNEVCQEDLFWSVPVLDLVKKIIEFPEDYSFCIGDIIDKQFDTIEVGLNIKQSIYDTTLEVCKKLQISLEEIPKDERLFDDPYTWPITKKSMLSEEYNNENKYHFYKMNKNDTIWWIKSKDKVGEHLFTFDKKKIYNLFRDYPKELTKEEKEVFDRENPYWADFFKDRN